MESGGPIAFTVTPPGVLTTCLLPADLGSTIAYGASMRISRLPSSRRRSALIIAAVLGLLLVSLQIAEPSSALTDVQSPRSTALARATNKSWIHHVKCRATVTTLRQVLGKKKNNNGGATYRGGRFKPGIPDRRDFTPPCFQKHTPTFVQLNRIKLGLCKQINDDGDWTCTLFDPSVPRHRSAYMSSIHVETDKKFRLRTSWSEPPGDKLLDIQGFVFWDPGHTKAEWHQYSGWEIHSLTAWRHSPRR